MLKLLAWLVLLPFAVLAWAFLFLIVQLLLGVG